ncbi:MAG: PQQ-dependent sugar dehydrogenase [Pirellulales bacterium]
MVRATRFAIFVCCIAVGYCSPARTTAAEVKPADDAKPAESPTFECRWTADPITVDGRADEPAWKNAVTIDEFGQPWTAKPDSAVSAAGGATSPKTKVRMLWDANGLYFFAEMEDADLFADLKEQDSATWTNDVFELFFRPSADKPSYYEFQVTPLGTRLDMFIPERDSKAFTKFVKADPFDWRTAVALRGTLERRDDVDSGWSVEGAIPWTDMAHTGGRPAIDETWRFALCRYDYGAAGSKPELSSCAPLTEPNFHKYEDYARLTFRGPDEAQRRPYGIAKRIPLTTSRVVGAPDPPPPFRTVRAFPNLKLIHPIIARRIPDSSQLCVLTHESQSKATSLVRFADDAEAESTEPIFTVEGLAYDFCFHPKFADNGYVYVGWAGPIKAAKGEKVCRISRFMMQREPPYAVEPKSETSIIDWKSDGHNGCAIAFSNDGHMFVTTGDGTSDSDDNNVGQDMTTLLAKVLRIDVDNIRPEDKKAGRNYSIPPDNPFMSLARARPETWAYGLRNPWRAAVDPRTDHLWVTQNGQDLFEQTYFVRRGDNFGWSITEGSAPFYTERKRGPTPIVPPAAEHAHSEARSLTGGVVYHGEKFPELRGCYLYGDYSTGKIWAIRHDGERVTYHQEIADTTHAITGFGLDSRGELLVCDYQPGEAGGLYRFERTPPTEPSDFPRKLSESGLFEVGKGHTPVPGMIPYTVNSPLWSDVTYKERFLALPGDGVATYASRKSWDFPEGTVLVKSFALEAKADDPKSRRWIETRFMTKQQKEWVGYSYAWNDEQTDAELVEARGRDREFTIEDTSAVGGKRTQAWHYPSRAECMVCHSRAANYVLGVSTAQLNCTFSYDGAADNQLRTLEHLGVVKLDASTELREGVVEAARKRGLSSKDANQYWDDIRKVRGRRAVAGGAKPDSATDLMPRLADPADGTAGLEERARSYLHANCAHCHVPAGGGNAQFDVAYWSALGETRTVGAAPVHQSFQIADAKLLKPGQPEASLLWHRMALHGRGQMPPLASAHIDPLGAELIRRWIAELPRDLQVESPTTK